MSQRTFYYNITFVLHLVSLSLVAGNATAAAAADQVLYNANVYTVNEKQPWAQAIAIRKGKIVFVGSDAGARGYVDEHTQVRNMQKRLIMPGFQDAHVHPMEGMSLGSFMGCDLLPLRQESNDPEDWIEGLKACNEIDFPHDWILGGGHDNGDLETLERLPRELLDEVFPDKPAAFMEKSSHSMWVNSKALERLGINSASANPQGGKFFKDPVTGQLTGVLSDSAGDELMHKALAKTAKLQEARFDAVLGAQALMASYGITSAANARVYWTRGNLEPWQRAEREGGLKIRNVMSLWAYPHLEDEYQLQQLKNMYREDPSSLLRVTQVKFYSDGVPDLNSAAVLKPYGHLIHPDADPTGGNYFTESRLARYLAELQKVGFGGIIHAIGDRGAHEALNAIEQAQRAMGDLGVNTPRHYVTHVNWVSAQDIPRFKQLNVPADSQVNYLEYEDYVNGYGNYYEPYSRDTADEPMSRLLINNESDTMAMPDIISTGARLVISSDWDVAELNPLFSIQNATQEYQGARVDGRILTERELLALAVKAYTYNASYALRHEQYTGSLEVGKFADLVVLDRNIFEVAIPTIRDTNVLLTMVGGKPVYRSPGFRMQRGRL
jgi:predicted amidohydrolase YtcJ